MKIVKIVMATAADELKNERHELGDYIRTLNDHYHNKGIYFRLANLLDFDTDEDQQREVCESEFFYIIFSDEADDGIVKKFDIALEHFKEKNTPRIYTYFQKLPDSADATDSVRNFMEKLDKEIGHYYSIFLHLDSIKLNMLLELTRTQVLKETIDVKDGKALVDGEEMLSLGNVPLFQKHKELQNLFKEREKLKEERKKYQNTFEVNHRNDEARMQLQKTTDRIDEITQQLCQLETEIFKTYTTITEYYHLDRPLKEEEKRALHCIENGDYEGALKILRNIATKENLQHVIELKKKTEEESNTYIRAYKLRIQALKAIGVNEKTIPEIIGCYEEFGKFAIEQKTERNIVYEYADFLFKQNKLSEALEKAQFLWRVYEEDKNVDNKEKGELLILIGNLLTRFYKYEDAEKIYKKAIEIEEDLVQNSEKTHHVILADCYNGLGTLLNQLYCYQESVYNFKKAIECIEFLPDTKDKSNLRKLSIYYTNLALAQDGLKNFKESETNYSKAIEIEESLYLTEDKLAHGSDLAIVYNNFGFSLNIRKDYKRAEEYYNKAIALEKELINENPFAYEYLLATTYVNMSILLRINGETQKSEDLVTKAISIFERLPEENIKAYRNELALSYYSLGENYSDSGKYDKAEVKYKQAILIWEQLTEEKVPVFKDKLLEGYLSLGILLSRREKGFKQAEESYKKAIKIAQFMTEQNHNKVFDGQLARCYVALADLYELKCEEKEGFEKAKAYYEKARELQQTLAKNDFSNYGGKLAQTLTRLANLYRKNTELQYDNESYIEAMKLNSEAKAVFERLKREGQTDNANLAGGHYSLGRLYLRLDKYKKAEEEFKKSIAEQDRLIRKTIENDENLAVTFECLGETLKMQGRSRYLEAEKYYDEAKNIWIKLGAKKNNIIIKRLKEEIKNLHDENNVKKEPSEILFKQTGTCRKLHQKAQEGDVDAQYQLGKQYYYGKNRNYTEAVKYFQMAIENNSEHIKALYMLGKCYEDGMGTRRDLSEAVICYKKAADLKHVKAMFKLGLIYQQGGNGFKKNLKEAVKFYHLAADQGNYAKAQYALGLCYYNGEGVDRNLDEAKNWFSKAAQNGDSLAQAMLEKIQKMNSFEKIRWKCGL